MKIFSEVREESEAKKFEEILMGVIKECADDEYSRKLALFSKKNIYPKYINDATIHAEFNRDEPNATGFPSHCVPREVDGFCGMTQGKTLNAFKQFNEVVVVHNKERCL